jgi:quercetin dioxygenase-like cupin family protein
VNSAYTHFADLAKQVVPPADGTLSRTLLNDDRTKIVLFAFSAGQELSEHTSSMPAILHFLSGDARVTLGPDQIDVRAGAWIHMPAGLRHSIRADTPVVMLLILLKATVASDAAAHRSKAVESA